MKSKSEYLLSFDPGGKGKFAWAIINSSLDPSSLITGTADNCEQAFTHSLKSFSGNLICIAIDSPMAWSYSGVREVDNRINKIYANSAQHINSLRGACLAQGIMLLSLIDRKFNSRKNKVFVTETHPKFLKKLLRKTKDNCKEENIIIKLANENYRSFKHKRTDKSRYDDEHDAIIGLLSAWAAFTKPNAWINLLEYEEDEYLPLGFRPQYWMPKFD